MECITSQELKKWTCWNSPDEKSTENYQEYALCWRKKAARVQPPMSEREITEMFIRTQEPEYYERMLCMMG